MASYTYNDLDDEDDRSWIEISSSSSSSGDDDDELSYDISIDDELRSSEKVECLSTTLPSRSDCQNRANDKPLHPSRPSPTSWQRSLWLATKLSFLLIPLVVAKFALRPSIDFGANEESIYVPGVGFSGFWFSLGRLKSIPDPASKQYVCFSAGCLGSVAIMNGFSVDEMACMAQSAQMAWKAGDISRYEVVRNFVDGLVYRNFPAGPGGDVLNCLERLQLVHDNSSNSNTTNIGSNPHLLSKLHILTTTSSMTSSMRSPTNLAELREMLIQTTWM